MPSFPRCDRVRRSSGDHDVGWSVPRPNLANTTPCLLTREADFQTSAISPHLVQFTDRDIPPCVRLICISSGMYLKIVTALVEALLDTD
jgi:hypothetical protein